MRRRGKRLGRAATKIASDTRARDAEHLRGWIDAGNLAAGRRELGQPLARAAADLEHARSVHAIDQAVERRADPRIVMQRVPASE